MRKTAPPFDKKTKPLPSIRERNFVMKKWIAPFLVLALAVLLIVCGKGITEKILERNADKTDSGRKLHASQMISSFTADFIAPRCTYETSGEIIFFSPDGEPSERSLI